MFIWKANMVNRGVYECQWQPTPVLLTGKSHGWRSLVGCSPWGREESDLAEWLPFHFSLSCIGEGNGNPLQCSCLENPREGGAWWAATYGVAQSQTRLKWLSSMNAKLTRVILWRVKLDFLVAKEKLDFLEFPFLVDFKLVLTSRKLLWDLEGGSKAAAIMLSKLV